MGRCGRPPCCQHPWDASCQSVEEREDAVIVSIALLDLQASLIRRRIDLPPTDWCIAVANSPTHLRYSPPPSYDLGRVENWTPVRWDTRFVADFVCLGRLRVRRGLRRQLPPTPDECGTPHTSGRSCSAHPFSI